jgi:hypothetical protein
MVLMMAVEKRTKTVTFFSPEDDHSEEEGPIEKETNLMLTDSLVQSGGRAEHLLRPSLGPQGKTLGEELTKLVTHPSYPYYNDSFVLYLVKGLIQVYEPLIGPEVRESPEEVSPQKHTGRVVPERVKAKVAQGCLLPWSRTLHSNQAKVGVVVYVGSPLDGEMVVINGSVVNDWITFIGNAIKSGAIKADHGMLRSETLAKLIKVSFLPENRHLAVINYGNQQPCAASQHERFRWTSTKYSCSITSCRLFDDGSTNE